MYNIFQHLRLAGRASIQYIPTFELFVVSYPLPGYVCYGICIQWVTHFSFGAYVALRPHQVMFGGFGGWMGSRKMLFLKIKRNCHILGQKRPMCRHDRESRSRANMSTLLPIVKGFVVNIQHQQLHVREFESIFLHIYPQRYDKLILS